MSDVKWIKLSVSMFDDEKIRIIESMPDADTILICWVKLLSLAGKTNANGFIFLAENIPYTDEMLATVFNRPLNTVRMALETFRKFGMIEVDQEHYINIKNWGKHQSVQGLEKIREDTRKRVAAHRAKKKNEQLDCNVTCNGEVTDKEEDKELDKEEDKDLKDIKEYSPDESQDKSSDKKDSIPYQEIIEYLNAEAKTKYQHKSKKTRELINARWKEGFTLEDFKQVIDTKTTQWLNDPKMSIYLRPLTLFGNKFESYQNEKVNKSNNQQQYGNHINIPGFNGNMPF
ncbi:phage replisome organizer N-terminal domain-containing protein [Bacillus albus]|uniref:phage replisome organizer N-terminal domain-containing protein n=1 Tax=Bacillus albus TaxID=2026189 RepID=UPI0018A1805E|nr:phage replisome organizer N-terminal domain-containing protein [Bacillus albus]MBF7154055.1 phage replisome organizer N-terminal domain-containing protein [Bacillus albus]